MGPMTGTMGTATQAPGRADAASRWLQQQHDQAQARTASQQQAQAMMMGNRPHPAMAGGAQMGAQVMGPMQPHPAVQQALAEQAHMQSLPHPMQQQGWMQNQGGGGMQAAQQAAFAPHPAMAGQPSGMYAQQPQAAIHPAVQQALDQQAHLQSQLGAMRVQPQAASPWNAGPQAMGTMGNSMWGGR